MKFLLFQETLPLRSFSATPKKFEAEFFEDISFSSTTKLKNELTSANIPNIKSFCPVSVFKQAVAKV